MNTEQASKVLAKACGVHLYNIQDDANYLGRFEIIWLESEWTIDDARCREMVEEAFKISIQWVGDRGMGHGMYWIAVVNEKDVNISRGTKKETSIACMIKIADNLEEKANENMR